MSGIRFYDTSLNPIKKGKKKNKFNQTYFYSVYVRFYIFINYKSHFAIYQITNFIYICIIDLSKCYTNEILLRRSHFIRKQKPTDIRKKKKRE